MEIGAVFFLLAVLIPVGLYLAQPFRQRRVRRNVEEEHEISTLMAEYDRTLTSLQELEFDNTLGKIPADDYPRQRAELMQHGAEYLRRLDELQAQTSTADAESRLEAAVAARRADAAADQPAVEMSDDDLESMIAARRKARKDKSAGFCPKCGKPILVSDRFCPSCGKAIN